MKKILSYRATMSRHQAIRGTIDLVVLAFSSWPRLLLEVFFRRDFGERYFSFSSAVMVTLVLAYYPIIKDTGVLSFFGRGYHYGEQSGIGEIIRQNLLWYGYLVAFMIMAYRRRQELQRVPGHFDMARYSLSTGVIDRRFFDIEFGGKEVTVRTVETLLEPALFFFIGLLLWFFGQPLGKLFVLCSIIYSLSYQAMYRLGDEYLLDLIDKRIVNENLSNVFVDGEDASEAQGLRFYGRIPADPNFRKELVPLMLDREPAIEVI
jgi:hypothetical protein